jgi:hypothetical protein
MLKIILLSFIFARFLSGPAAESPTASADPVEELSTESQA